MKLPHFLKGIFTGMAVLMIIFSGAHPASADVNTAVPIDSVGTGNLPVTANKNVDIKIKNKNITDTTAQFDIELKSLKNTLLSLIITVTDPQGNKTQEAFGGGTAITPSFDRGTIINASSRVLSPLLPNTTYTMQLSDTSQSITSEVIYQKVSFKTAAPAPVVTTEPIPVQKASLKIIMNTPKVEVDSNTPPNTTFKATISGKFSSTLNLKSHLQLFFGSDPNNLTLAATLSPEQVIPANTEKTFTATIPRLEKDTTYYYSVRELVNNYEITSASGSLITPIAADMTEMVIPTAAAHQAVVKITSNNPEFIKHNTLDRYHVVISGNVTTTANARTGLEVLISDPGTQNSFYSGALLLTQTVVFNGQPKAFSGSLFALLPGTKYHYKIRETTKDYMIYGNEVKSFTTPGTAPVDYVYNADTATGELLDYEFPTQLGEPTGTVAITPEEKDALVPCGKRSDQDNETNKNCKFVHLFGGVDENGEEIPGLIPRVFDYLLILLVPVIVMMCIYTGVQMIIHRGIPAELTKYKENFKRIGIGIALMLLAWTIIATLLKTLVNPSMSGFILLDLL
jgi:uncharacterized membrane protein